MGKDTELQSQPKAEIKVKENPKAEAIKKVPDEDVAMAIRDMLLREKLK